MKYNYMSSLKHEPRFSHASRSAFSLVELLVVIGIISLLIGIALPAFSSAKTSVKKASTSATIHAMATGIDTFRADEKFGGSYPPSYYFEVASPYATGVNLAIGGAGLAVWALAGADLQGTPGFRDLDHTDNTGGIAPWANDTHATAPMGMGGVGGLYQLQGSLPAQPRSSFVDVSKMKFAERKTTGSEIYFEAPTARGQKLTAPCFLDSFDQPILYYKANPGRPKIVCNLPPAQFFSASFADTGIYNLADNSNVATLNDGLNFGAGNSHFKSQNASLGDVFGPRAVGAENNPNFRNSFGWTVFNPSSTVWSPYNAETYILLSAGPDGIFGTPDDIANYEMNR